MSKEPEFVVEVARVNVPMLQPCRCCGRPAVLAIDRERARANIEGRDKKFMYSVSISCSENCIERKWTRKFARAEDWMDMLLQAIDGWNSEYIESKKKK